MGLIGQKVPIWPDDADRLVLSGTARQTGTGLRTDGRFTIFSDSVLALASGDVVLFKRVGNEYADSEGLCMLASASMLEGSSLKYHMNTIPYLSRKRSAHRQIVLPVAFFAIAIAAIGLIGTFTGQTDNTYSRYFGKKPVVAPLIPAVPDLIEPAGSPALSPAAAAAINAAIPASNEPIRAARPFTISLEQGGINSFQTALNCLTTAIYYEAASESDKGQRAVAQVILNRVKHPTFPKTICGVVYQGSERSTGCQFSFTCDGSLARVPNAAVWDRARRIASAALAGVVEPSVGTATHYHTIWVVPYWAKSLAKIRTIDAHIFYRWPGYWGTLSALRGAYAGEAVSVVEQPDILEATEEALNLEIPDYTNREQIRLFGGTNSRLLADEHVQRSKEGEAPVKPAPAADASKAPLIADENKGVLIVE